MIKSPGNDLTAVQTIAVFGGENSILSAITELPGSRFDRTTHICDARRSNDCPGSPSGDLRDVARIGADLIVLDGRFRQVLIAKYPNSAKFVWVRFDFGWLVQPLLILGAIRRMAIGAISFDGFVSVIASGGKKKYFIKFRNLTRQAEDSIYLSLSETVGMEGFVSYLNEQDVDYLIPRFFERFPNLHRHGGDLDILVSDSTADVVRDFLKANSGSIPVDVHTVYGPAPGSGEMPYYPPQFASDMLDKKIFSQHGFWCPDEESYFYSFAYHIVFHKGFSSGVRSKDFPGMSLDRPENDYGAHLCRLGAQIGISLDVDRLYLEDIEEILKARGLYPQLDTLVAMGSVNKYLSKKIDLLPRFCEVGLSVIIFKRRLMTSISATDIQTLIEKKGFAVLEIKDFSDDEVNYYKALLRGGNWYSATDRVGCEPKVAMLIQDTKAGSSSERIGTKRPRVRLLKEYLRRRFDNEPESQVHATDDSLQALEYVGPIWGVELKAQLSRQIEISEKGGKKGFGLIRGSSIEHLVHKLKETVKQSILRRFE